MNDFATLDFLTDSSMIPDPYPYYEYLREQGPAVWVPPHGFVGVFGRPDDLDRRFRS